METACSVVTLSTAHAQPPPSRHMPMPPPPPAMTTPTTPITPPARPPQTIDAVRCAWEVQAALLAAPWPPELLKHPACAEVYSSAAAGGHVLFR